MAVGVFSVTQRNGLISLFHNYAPIFRLARKPLAMRQRWLRFSRIGLKVVSPGRAFGNGDLSEADRTLDRAGVSPE